MPALGSLPVRSGVLAGKESLPLSQRHNSGPTGKNPPREAMMNHESSGYPLTLSRTNNATHVPTSWQGISTPAMPPRKWGRRVSWSHSWGMGTTRVLVTAGTSGIPPGREKEHQIPTMGIRTRAAHAEPECRLLQRLLRWYLTLATSSGQDSRTSWQNLCHETPATRALRQPCVPAWCQPPAKGRQDELPPSPPGPQPSVPETRSTH